MNTKKYKFSLQNILKSSMGLIFTFLLFAVVLYSVISMIPKQKRSQEAKLEAEMELRELQEQKTSLEQEIGLLSSDFGREKALREKFGVVKEGEEIIVLVENEEAAPLVKKKGLFGWFSRIFSGK